MLRQPVLWFSVTVGIVLFAFGHTAFAYEPNFYFKATYKLDDKALQAAVDGRISARGVMTHEFKDNCVAWYSQKETTVDFKIGDKEQRISIHESLLETKSGSQFVFTYHAEHNGQVMAHLDGEAYRQNDGTVEYYFNGLDGKAAPLPQETLFPVAAQNALIQELMNGNRTFAARVFDGRYFGGYLSSAAVVEPLEGLELAGKENLPGTQGASWSLQQSESELGNVIVKEVFHPNARSFRRLFENGLAEYVSTNVARLPLMTFVLQDVLPSEPRKCDQ